MINKVLLEGRIVRDFNLKTTEQGTKLAMFVLANTNTIRKDKRTDFVPCVVFGKQAEIASQYLKKGSLVSVEGALYVDSKKTDTGEFKTYFNVQCHRIHFLDSKSKESNPSENEMVMSMKLDENNEQESLEALNTSLNDFLSQTEADVYGDYPF